MYDGIGCPYVGKKRRATSLTLARSSLNQACYINKVQRGSSYALMRHKGGKLKKALVWDSDNSLLWFNGAELKVGYLGCCRGDVVQS